MREVRLRDVVISDIPVFFEQQRHPNACWMAAFTAEDPSDRVAYDALWTSILANDRIVKRTIVDDAETVVGNMVHFTQYGLPAVGYWIDPAQWGRGIATRGLGAFLEVVTERPLYARTAFDNYASQRVLEKCGFTFLSLERGYAAARGAEIDERIYVLRARPPLAIPELE